MSKLVAIVGGGDWTDASVHHVVVPAGVNLEAQRIRWRTWYDVEYLPAFHREEKPKYLTFPQWLLTRCGAREATEADIIVFGDEG